MFIFSKKQHQKFKVDTPLECIKAGLSEYLKIIKSSRCLVTAGRWRNAGILLFRLFSWATLNFIYLHQYSWKIDVIRTMLQVIQLPFDGYIGL